MSVPEQTGLDRSDVERSAQLNFSANIDPDDGEQIKREVPFGGKHIELLYASPAATQNQVGVKMTNKATGNKVFPGDRETEFINVADVVHPFVLVFDVTRGDELQVTYENRSTTAHYLNVISTIVKPREGRR